MGGAVKKGDTIWGTHPPYAPGTGLALAPLTFRLLQRGLRRVQQPVEL